MEDRFVIPRPNRWALPLMLWISLALGTAASLSAQDVKPPAAPGIVAEPNQASAPGAAAAAPPKADKGDTAWMLTSAALVLSGQRSAVAIVNLSPCDRNEK